MRIAIFGCRDGEYIYEQLKNVEHEIVCFFCDNNPQMQGKEIDGILVVSAERLIEINNTVDDLYVLVSVRNGYNRWSIVDQLVSSGINRNRIGLIKPSAITYQWDMQFTVDENGYISSKYLLWIKDVKKPLIYYLEIHAHDSCNLNCKGCLHFSSLYSKEEIPENIQMINDVNRVNDKCHIFHLRILGGEPLLNPNLGGLITELRSILPDTDIGIVTNGTLISKQKTELFEIMKKNQVGFNITLYPPTYNRKEAIYQILNENGVSYGSHLAKADEFSKGFMIHKQSRETCESHEKCVSKGCIFLRNGRLYKCAPEALIDRFYKKFDIDIDTSSAGVDIYNDELEWDTLIYNLYAMPVKQCLYCSNKLEKFSWGISNPPRIEDWCLD